MASDSIAGVNGWLKSKAAITAIVGARIIEKGLGQNPIYPALSFFSVFVGAGHTHDFDIGPFWDRVQFDCWATSKSDLDSLADALINAGKTGISGTFNGVVLGGALFLGARELEGDYRGTEVLETVRRKIVEFKIWFR